MISIIKEDKYRSDTNVNADYDMVRMVIDVPLKEARDLRKFISSVNCFDTDCTTKFSVGDTVKYIGENTSLSTLPFVIDSVSWSGTYDSFIYSPGGPVIYREWELAKVDVNPELKFKIGDEVICVNARYTEDKLVEGKVYIVKGIDEYRVAVEGVCVGASKFSIWFQLNRFKFKG